MSLFCLLTARSPGLEITPRGFGALKPADVAHMLRGLPQQPFLMAMVVECGDLGSLPDLERWLWLAVIDMANRNHWPFQSDKPKVERRKEWLRTLAALALFEILTDKQCSTCNGNGGVKLHGSWLVCDRCSGRGRIRISERQRAEWTQMARHEWRGEWAERYEHVYRFACGWHEQAKRHIRKKAVEFRTCA